ncbi:hypothetical protein RHSIM_Rhsim02G0151300 [Rhododendron simsii]|uniref:Uncharacterized protein n=1 Tax=Rhododendron simsii TaxID=118357 RepID=A0A834HAH2_RHOSS|nr:hypothetical protein RHSIM_Rhsim02G0151300 [Rhododendron simsii]
MSLRPLDCPDSESSMPLTHFFARELSVWTPTGCVAMYVFNDKILHISDVEVRGTEMMGDTPRNIVAVGTIGTSSLNSSFLEPKGFIDGSLNCDSSKPGKSIVNVIDLVQ